MLKNMWAHSRRYTFMAFFQAPFGVLEALLTIYLSQAVVSAITQALEPLAVLTQTALIGAALLLCACAKKYLYAHMEPFMLDHDIRYDLMLFQHTISADYEAMESPEELNRMAQALKNTGSDTSPTRIVVKTMSSFLENSIGIVAYGGDFGQPQPLDSADRQRYHHRQLSADAPELRLGLPQQGPLAGRRPAAGICAGSVCRLFPGQGPAAVRHVRLASQPVRPGFDRPDGLAQKTAAGGLFY